MRIGVKLFLDPDETTLCPIRVLRRLQTETNRACRQPFKDASWEQSR